MALHKCQCIYTDSLPSSPTSLGKWAGPSQQFSLWSTKQIQLLLSGPREIEGNYIHFVRKLRSKPHTELFKFPDRSIGYLEILIAPFLCFARCDFWSTQRVSPEHRPGPAARGSQWIPGSIWEQGVMGSCRLSRLVWAFKG